MTSTNPAAETSRATARRRSEGAGGREPGAGSWAPLAVLVLDRKSVV